MKKEMKNLAQKAVEDIASKPISRKEAIKKTGYMAASAATMMILLSNPAKAGNTCETSHTGSNDQGGNNQQHSTTKNSGIWK
jgi:hypothetical protein